MKMKIPTSSVGPGTWTRVGGRFAVEESVMLGMGFEDEAKVYREPLKVRARTCDSGRPVSILRA